MRPREDKIFEKWVLKNFTPKIELVRNILSELDKIHLSKPEEGNFLFFNMKTYLSVLFCILVQCCLLTTDSSSTFYNGRGNEGGRNSISLQNCICSKCFVQDRRLPSSFMAKQSPVTLYFNRLLSVYLSITIQI